MTIRRPALALLVIATWATAVACSDRDTTPSAATSTTSPAAGSTVAQSAPTASASATSIRLRTVQGRDVLVDNVGRALYVFDKDTPGLIACAGECLVKWPALMGPVAAEAGIDPGKLAIMARPDGTSQVGFAGKPLYYFAQDVAPGDTRGQGLMGLWHLIGPDGRPVP
ncbi:hypothetical protein [Nocardia nepalensis]|uniref:COG4315 family predicted lipoprotein n=1 Tax=Nocardia nepalensis TaxID=3375448 RepID=UPI003B679158